MNLCWTSARPVRARALLMVVLMVVLTAVLAATLSVLITPPAQAHARLVATVPTDAGIVDPGAAEVRLIFNEPVAPAADGFVVYDAAGDPRPAIGGSVDSDVVVALPPDLTRGSYLLSWRVVSADGHVIAGTLTFGYGESYRPVSAPHGWRAAEPAAVVALGVAQVIAYLGLLIMAGLAWFSAAVLRGPAGPADPTGRAGRAALWVSALAGVVASLLLAPLARLVDSAERLSGLLRAEVWRSAFGSSDGLAPLLALVGAAVVLGAAVRRAAAGPARRWTAVVAATVALSSFTLLGHTRTQDPVGLTVAADLVHVTAAAGWLGGIVGLALVLRRHSEPRPGAQLAAVWVSRFSALAAILVASLGASGVALAVLILPTPWALISTGYGQVLLVKLALVAVVAVLALWNRTRLLPAVIADPSEADRWRRLRAAVRDELLILVAVVCTTGVLVSLSPNDAGPRVGVDTSTSTFGGSLGGGSEVTGSLSPGRVGENVVELSVRGADGQLLAPVELPDVQASLAEPAIGPLEASVTELIPGRYRATVRLDAPGRWDVEIAVRTSEEAPRSSVLITVEVER